MAKTKSSDLDTADTSEQIAPSAQNLALVGGIVRGLSVIVQDPALGVRGIAISRALGVLATVIEAKGQVDAGLADLDAQVKQMVKEENRAPDLQEWSDLHHRSDAAHAAIQGTPPPTP